MTSFSRVAIVAAFSLGIFGLGGLSTPGQAVQTASGVITADLPLPQFTDLTLTDLTVSVPQVSIEPTPAVDHAVQSAAPAPAMTDPTDDAAADPSPRFDSLAAAVAGQTAPGDLSRELKCLAGAVFYESKGEPLAGQLAVAEVIINRARSGRFPTSLCGVVTQAGQFSFVRGGAIPAINPASTQWKTALAVAQVALGDDWDSPAQEALFFHARYVQPSWGKPRLASIGNHVFYR